MYVSWWDDKCRWPECRLEFGARLRDGEQYYQTIKWIYQNIERAERHARWRLQATGQEVFGLYRFRYEQDLIMFSLRWL